jgi:hypothetical protein
VDTFVYAKSTKISNIFRLCKICATAAETAVSSLGCDDGLLLGDTITGWLSGQPLTYI